METMHSTACKYLSSSYHPIPGATGILQELCSGVLATSEAPNLAGDAGDLLLEHENCNPDV